MGIVSRQGSWNAISIGAGVLIGGLSTVVIFPYVFRDNYDQWGTIQVLISYAFLFSQFLIIGVPHIASRYLPQFRGKPQERFLSLLVLFMPLVMVGLFLLLFTLAPDFILHFVKEEERPVIKSYLLVLVLLTCCVTYFRCFAGFSNAHLRSITPLVLSEVFVRVMVVTGVALFYFGYYDFRWLMWHYVAVYGLQAAIMGFTLIKKFVRPALSVSGAKLKEITRYGLFASVDGAASMLLQYLDILMLAYFVTLEEIAFFTLGMFIGTLVQIPARSLSSITMPLISKAWEEKNMEELSNLYHKSSLTQMLIGAIILLLIAFNVDSLYAMMKPELSAGKVVAIIIGAAKLINISAGVNGTIIVMSKAYIYNFYFNVTLIVLTFLTNLWLIPTYGIAGAAIGTCISIFLFNLIKAVFIWKTMNLQPFGRGHLYTLLLAIAVGLIGWVLPRFEGMHILNIAYVSAVMGIVYAVVAYKLKISTDINQLVDGLLRKVRLIK